MDKHDGGKGPQEEDVKLPKPNFDQKHEPGAHEADDEDRKAK